MVAPDAQRAAYYPYPILNMVGEGPEGPEGPPGNDGSQGPPGDSHVPSPVGQDDGLMLAVESDELVYVDPPGED